MKKWALGIFAALAVGYFGLLPFESTDAGELYVVETLLVEADENQVRLYSGDTMAAEPPRRRLSRIWSVRRRANSF